MNTSRDGRVDTADIAREVLRHRIEPQTFEQTRREVELVQSLTPNAFKDVRAFHEKFAIDYKGKPRVLDFELLQFRLKFMREEMTEYEKHADAAHFELDKQARPLEHQKAFDPVALRHHLAGMVDALVDLVYVAMGTAHLQGFDFDEAWRKVHIVNMEKERSAGEARSAEERIKLKMVKPLGWKAPDHIDQVHDNAHQS